MPTLNRTRHRSAQGWGWLAASAATLGLLWTRDPNQTGSYGLCPLRALTGLDCPFCGGLRGTYALLHGDVGTALDHNLLLPLYLGLLLMVALAGWFGFRRTDSGDDGSALVLLQRVVRAKALWWAVGLVTVIFFVVRNLSWFPYLSSAG